MCRLKLCLVGLGLTLWATVIYQVVAEVSPVVNTANGPYQGVLKEARDGSSFVAFEGVRFANPPGRFKAPEPLSETWTEPKKADTSGNSCPHMAATGDFAEDEDCLFLNVYVPEKKLASKPHLPVMFWVHGGGFLFGDGYGYRPDYFMDGGDTIIVTTNYRLGIFGFLGTEDNTVTANNGLRDIVMALQWVQQNIQAFNGDPSKVTLFGHSAGSVAVHYVLMSPSSEGLYQRAIMQSGAFAFWSYDPNPKETVSKLAKYVGCSEDSNSVEIVKCLEGKSAKELLTAQNAFRPRWPGGNGAGRFLPTSVESQDNSPFFSDHPKTLFSRSERTKYPNKVPVIIGVTSDEGATLFAAFVLSNPEFIEDINKNWEKVAPIAFYYEDFIHSESLSEVSKKIRQFYFGSKEVSLERVQNLAYLYTDMMFLVPVMLAADEMSNEGMQVYPYVFAYAGNWTLRKALGVTELPGMVGHADELQYLFPHDFLGPPLKPNSDEERFSKALVKFWKAFAKNGKPSTEWYTKAVIKLNWNPISRNTLSASQKSEKPLYFDLLHIDMHPNVVGIDFNGRINFWVKLIQDYGINLAATTTKQRTEL